MSATARGKPVSPILCPGGIATGLVLGLPLHEGSGLTAHDLSGQGSDGTLNSGASWTAGQAGYCLSFNGTASNQCDCGTPLAGQTLTRLSIAAWLYRSSTSNLVSFGWGDTSGQRLDVLWFTDGNVYWQCEGVSTVSFPNCPFNQTGWHHFVSTFDGSQSGLARQNVYIDGVQQTLTGGGGGAPTAYAVTGHFRLGYEQSNGRNSVGNIDGAGVWTRTLSSADVTAIYADSWQMYRRSQWRLKVAAAGGTFQSAWARGSNQWIGPGVWTC